MVKSLSLIVKVYKGHVHICCEMEPDPSLEGSIRIVKQIHQNDRLPAKSRGAGGQGLTKLKLSLASFYGRNMGDFHIPILKGKM